MCCGICPSQTLARAFDLLVRYSGAHTRGAEGNERTERSKITVTHWGAPEVVAGRTKGRVHTSNGECAAVGQGGAVSSGAVVEAQERDRERGIRHNTTAPTPPEHWTDRRANGRSGRAEGGATHRGTGCDARDARPLPYWRQDARHATRAVRRDAERSLDPPRAPPARRARSCNACIIILCDRAGAKPPRLGPRM